MGVKTTLILFLSPFPILPFMIDSLQNFMSISLSMKSINYSFALKLISL